MESILDEGANLRRLMEEQAISRQAAIMKAYKNATSRRKFDKQDESAKSVVRIQPLQKVIPSNMTKFNHSPCPQFGSSHGPPPVTEKWWIKSPTIAGEASNPYQLSLADPGRYTGRYKALADPSSPTPVAGDYIDDPKKAMKLLNARTYKELNIAGRSADFCTEVNWRLSLRPDN